MAGESTEDALLNFSCNLFDGLNKGICMSDIYIDITKAFDSVTQEILLNRLAKVLGLADLEVIWWDGFSV